MALAEEGLGLHTATAERAARLQAPCAVVPQLCGAAAGRLHPCRPAGGAGGVTPGSPQQQPRRVLGVNRLRTWMQHVRQQCDERGALGSAACAGLPPACKAPRHEDVRGPTLAMTPHGVKPYACVADPGVADSGMCVHSHDHIHSGIYWAAGGLWAGVISHANLPAQTLERFQIWAPAAGRADPPSRPGFSFLCACCLPACSRHFLQRYLQTALSPEEVAACDRVTAGLPPWPFLMPLRHLGAAQIAGRAPRALEVWL